MHITSPRCTSTSVGDRDDERLHSKHRHSSRSLQNQSMGRHRPGTQDSFRKKEDKDRGGSIPSKHHQRYKQEQEDAFQVRRDERSHYHETQRGHHYHQTHVLHQKGSKLHVESQLVTKQQVHRREHHQQHHHHHQHHHRKMDHKDDEWKRAEVHRQEHQKSKLSSHVEYSSQNEHNAQISARKTHLPNNTQSARSSQKSQKERSNRMEAGSARSSLKEKRTKQKDGKEIGAKEGGKKSQRMRKIEDPVYSLPPIMK